MHKRCLIVDDDPAVCGLIGKVLNSAGMEALTLTKSAEAPTILEEGKFDLVLLDLHMPSPDGIELARRMRRSRFHRTTPIILVSDDQRPSALSVGFAAGANYFIFKPIDKDRLWKLVRASQRTVDQERRRTRRVPLHSPVRLTLGEEELEGETVDVGMCGLLVRAPRTAPVGSSVRMNLRLSERGRPLVASGSVARIVGGNQMGIQLDQLTLGESERLQELLLPFIPNE